MNRFVICANCQKLRSLDHMAKSGRCVFCPPAGAPRLLPPAMPHIGRTEPEDAVQVQLRRMAER